MFIFIQPTRYFALCDFLSLFFLVFGSCFRLMDVSLSLYSFTSTWRCGHDKRTRFEFWLVQMLFKSILTLQFTSNVVDTCLQKATANSFSSMSIPTLGTGQLKYPADQVAHAMIRKIKDFLTTSDTSLMEVNIVIYKEDRATIKVGVSPSFLFFDIFLFQNVQKTKVNKYLISMSWVSKQNLCTKLNYIDMCRFFWLKLPTQVFNIIPECKLYTLSERHVLRVCVFCSVNHCQRDKFTF